MNHRDFKKLYGSVTSNKILQRRGFDKIEALLREVMEQQQLQNDLILWLNILSSPTLIHLDRGMKERISTLIWSVNQRLDSHRWQQNQKLDSHRFRQTNELSTHRWQQNQRLANMAWQLERLLEKRGWRQENLISKGFDQLKKLIPEKQRVEFAKAIPAQTDSTVLKNLDFLKEQVSRLEGLLSAKSSNSQTIPALQPLRKLILWLGAACLVLILTGLVGGYFFYQNWQEDAVAKDEQIQTLQEQNVALSKQLLQYHETTQTGIKAVKEEVATTKTELQAGIGEVNRQSRNRSWRLRKQVEGVELSLESLMPVDTTLNNLDSLHINN